MWSANIERKAFNKGNLEVEVIYSNEEDSFHELYFILSLEQLNNIISSRLDALNLLDISTIPLGDFVPMKARSQAEIDKQHYFDLLSKWNRIQEDIKNGLIKADNPAVVQLQIDLKAAYKPEYSGL